MSISGTNTKNNFKTDIMTKGNAFTTGLLTNILNPKATLFFLSLYSPLIATKTDIYILFLYGIWMAFITTLWFSLLSTILTIKEARFKNFSVYYSASNCCNTNFYWILFFVLYLDKKPYVYVLKEQENGQNKNN